MEKFPIISTPKVFTKRQKVKVPTTPSKRVGGILGREELPRTLINLENPPVVLSSWIGAKPRNIVQIASLEKGTGFNEIAWQDKGGSKLYLENLDPLGAINEELKVTYPQVESLAKASGWGKNLPDTIVVQSAGSQQIRMAAKNMVLELLDSYQMDPELQRQRGFKLPNKPILKETKTDNPSLGEFAIEFSVKGITQLEPIMGLGTYLDNYSHLFSDALLGALKTYQNNLKTGVVNGFRVEEVAERQGGAARKMFLDIKGAAEGLQSALKAEIADNKKKQQVIAGPGLHTLKEELATLERMQTQVVSALKDDFRNEFDTQRWKQWRALNPRTEDEIVPGTEEKAGSGVQGTVYKYELDPDLRRRPVVLKYDNNDLNDDATGAGLPAVNPQQSLRAVAAFKMSEQLQLGIIPRTEVFVGTDDTGRPKLGQAMEFVTGTIGQRKAAFKNEFSDAAAQRLNLLLSKTKQGSDASEQEKAEARAELAQGTYAMRWKDPETNKFYPRAPVNQKDVQEYEDIVNNPSKYPLDRLRNAQNVRPSFVKKNGEWYDAVPFPVNIDYGNAVVQQGLSNLQVFDVIIGHADRNAGNWIYETDKTDRITRVKGIDNDDTFGAKWSPERSKTKGIPPIVDISTALSILNANFNKDIRPSLAGLSGEEIAKAAERFAQAQQEIGQRVMAGQIASMEDVDQATLDQLHNKVTFIGPRPQPMPGILRWGDQGIAGAHTMDNSYLGLQLSEKNRLAQQFGVGALPGSGDVGFVQYV